MPQFIRTEWGVVSVPFISSARPMPGDSIAHVAGRVPKPEQVEAMTASREAWARGEI